MIETKNLTKTFDNFTAVDSLDLKIETGEFFGLLGPNGAGKTTTISLLSTLLLPTKGEILIDGMHLSKENENEVRTEMGMVFQSFNLFPHMSVMQNLTEAPVRVAGRSKDEARREATALLEKVGLSDKADAYPCELSGGQQQRVAIARALAMHPVFR